MSIDYYLFQQINNLAGRSVYLDSVGVFFAVYFQYVVVGALLVFLLAVNREERNKNLLVVGLVLGAVILSRLVITEVVRWLWARPRPFVTYSVYSLVVHEASFSFPSGHAAFFFALAAAVYFYGKYLFFEQPVFGLSKKRTGFWLFVAAAIISLARVFVGVHYPSDILAGALIGILSGWVIVKLFAKFYFK